MSEEEKEPTELEKEFEKIANDAQTKIDEKLKEAGQALEEAMKISEESGVPFSSDISFLSQSYIPTSFKKKYPELSIEFVTSVTGAYTSYNDDFSYGGWEHSAVC